MQEQIKETAQLIEATYNQEDYECLPCFCIKARDYVDWVFNTSENHADTIYEDVIPEEMRTLLKDLTTSVPEGIIKSAIDSISQQYFLEHAEKLAI